MNFSDHFIVQGFKFTLDNERSCMWHQCKEGEVFDFCNSKMKSFLTENTGPGPQIHTKLDHCSINFLIIYFTKANKTKILLEHHNIIEKYNNTEKGIIIVIKF